LRGPARAPGRRRPRRWTRRCPPGWPGCRSRRAPAPAGWRQCPGGQHGGKRSDRTIRQAKQRWWGNGAWTSWMVGTSPPFSRIRMSDWLPDFKPGAATRVTHFRHRREKRVGKHRWLHGPNGQRIPLFPGTSMSIQRTLIAAAIASALAVSVSPPAHAEPHAGIDVGEAATARTIVGIVREASVGASLDGAVISLDGREVATTRRNGEFRITGVAPGTYRLTVNYLGYHRAETEVVLPADSGARVEVSLLSTASAANATHMGKVEVRATRDANALALNQQRASTNYINVVSADLLGQFPDNNIAESTQRIPGISIERDQGEGRYVTVR